MESPTLYKYEKYSFKVITPLFGLISLAFLVNGDYITGSILFIMGGMTAFSYQGVIIDTASRKYMRYDRFLSFKFGSWKALSTPSYATIARINLSSERVGASPMVGPQDKKGATAFKVNLVVEGEERYISICRGSLDNMTEEALRLGSFLNVRVLDYSTHEKKWIL